MVQEFHVLRCFSCQSFQVQQVKKVNRWRCKLCGEKQSLLKEFGRGSGADCRCHVQKLNAMRGAAMEEQERNTWSLWEKVEEEDEPEEQKDDQVTQTQVSRWSKYLHAPEEAVPETGEEDNILMDRQQLHGNNAIDRKRKRRDRWTDRQRQDGWTPEQSNWLGKPVRPTTTTSLNHTNEPSLRSTSHTSLNHTNEPSLRSTSHTSLNHTGEPHQSLNSTSPPSKKHIHPPSVSSGEVSRWARFLSSDCWEDEKGVEQSVSGWRQPDASLSRYDITDQTPPLARPHPLPRVSSMFQSRDDFSFDEFLTADKI